MGSHLILYVTVEKYIINGRLAISYPVHIHLCTLVLQHFKICCLMRTKVDNVLPNLFVERTLSTT